MLPVLPVLPALLLLLGSSLEGETSSRPPPREMPAWPSRQLALTAAYVGEQGVHPGGQAGVEYALVPLRWLSVVGRLNLGGYVHYRYATSLYADVELGLRATTTGGFVVDLLGNAGYLHQFPNGVLYRVPEGGAPIVAPNPGFPAARLGGTLGLGADLSRTRLDWPVTITLRLGAFAQLFFGGGVELHPEAQLMLTWMLGRRQAPGHE